MAEDDRQAENQPYVPGPPGQVVSPYAAQAAPSVTAPVPQAAMPEQPEPVPPQVPTGLPDPAEDDPYAVQPDGQDNAYDAQLPEDSISWTASEFIAHEKNASWFMYLVISAVIIAALVYLITKDLITTGFLLFCAFILGAYARRKPRQMTYQVDGGGIQIGRRHFSYEEFKSFSLVPEGAFASIVLVPMKRFAPLTTMYFDPKDEEKIANMLIARLPYEEHKKDPIDNFMQRIRF